MIGVISDIKSVPNSFRKETKDLIWQVLESVPGLNLRAIPVIFGVIFQHSYSNGAYGTRSDLINLFCQFINDDWSTKERLSILNNIAAFKPYDARRVARALLFTRGGNDTILNLEKVLKANLTNEIRIDNINAIPKDLSPYAAGIDAHAGGRDQRTIEAIKIFEKSWPLKPEDIDRQYEKFFQAVQELEESKKSLVLRSLGVDQHGRVLPKPSGENFAGLLHGVDGEGNFILSKRGNRIEVHGRELIARFWHFAHAYVGNERDVLCRGIMNALAEGVIPTHNILRCEMGRVQLLLMATLQGRLKDIDGEVVDLDRLLNTGAGQMDGSIIDLLRKSH